MRKWIALSLALCLFPTVAVAQTWGPSVIGGAGVGYGVSGPEVEQTYVVQYAGIRALALPGASVYACWQRGLIPGLGIGGNGAELLLVSQWRDCQSLSMLAGLGFLQNLQGIQDSTDLKAGLTFMGGVSYDVTDLVDVGAIVVALDRGTRADWCITALLTIKDPQKLIPGL